MTDLSSVFELFAGRRAIENSYRALTAEALQVAYGAMSFICRRGDCFLTLKSHFAVGGSMEAHELALAATGVGDGGIGCAG